VSLLLKVKVFVDVGANIGNHCNFFAQKGATGSAFEPSAQNFQLLKYNAPGFACHKVALSRNHGEALLKTYPNSMGNNSLIQKGVGNDPERDCERVLVSTLDSFNLSGVSLLKIDAEGSELDILLGAEQTIAKSSPLIWIELHEDANLEAAQYGYRRADIVSLLADLGYVAFIKLDSTNFLFRKKKRLFFKNTSLL
jgi:FkbM family methyltransferase